MILVAKLGKWLFGKGVSILFLLLILFLIFLCKDVFYPKIKKAVDGVIAKEARQLTLEKAIEASHEKINGIRDAIDLAKLNLEQAELEEETILEQISRKTSDLKNSAHRDLQRRKQKAKDELKELEDDRPWAWHLSYWTGSHEGKIKLKKAKIEAMKLGSDVLGADHPLLKQREEIRKQIESAMDGLDQSNFILATAETKQKEQEFSLSKLTGNVTTTQEVVRAWRKFQPWIIWTVALIVLSPIIWSVFMFSFVAPVASKQTPIQLTEETGGVFWSEPRTTLNVALVPSGELWARSELMTQYDTASKRTAMFWNWRAPAVSVLSGLALCTQVTNNGEQTTRFALSSNDPEEEISEIVLADDVAVVLHVANIVAISGKVSVLARWRILNLNAWLTGQLRFLIFQGPGSIYICAPRGIEGFNVTDRQMVEQQVTIGFDSSLNYSVKRTEVFIPYLRGKASLFDDCFQGEGVMFRKNAASQDRQTLLERTFGSFFAILGKMMGF